MTRATRTPGDRGRGLRGSTLQRAPRDDDDARFLLGRHDGADGGEEHLLCFPQEATVLLRKVLFSFPSLPLKRTRILLYTVPDRQFL